MSALELYQIAQNPAWLPTIRRDELRLENGTALALCVPGQGWAFVLMLGKVAYISPAVFPTNRAALLGAIAQVNGCTVKVQTEVKQHVS